MDDVTIGRARLIRGDCLERMREIEAGSVDAVVTDPPFNAGKNFRNDSLSEIDFRAFINRLVLEIHRLAPANVLVETGKGDSIVRQEFDRYFTFRYTICLNYTNSMRNGAVGYSNWGQVLWYSRGGKCHRRYKDRLDSALHNTKGQFEHPSPKEVGHYIRLVEMFSPPQGVILDPFMGSGTTGIAAAQLGMSFIGIEIDPAHYQTARTRISAELARTPLFAG